MKITIKRHEITGIKSEYHNRESLLGRILFGGVCLKFFSNELNKSRRNLTFGGLSKFSGSLSQRARERSIRYGSVICMAKRYAPETTKRKVQNYY